MKHLYLISIIFISSHFIYGEDWEFPSEFNNEYNHYSNGQIKRFKICGERCSGTNFLSCLIQRNFSGLVEEFAYGHKHALYWFNEPLDPEILQQIGYSIRDASLLESDDCLFIVVIRDPYDWLRSFYLTPHHVHKDLISSGFMHFISNEWKSELNYYTKIDDINPNTKRPFSNIFELRKHKILNYLNLSNLVKNYLLVKYEDIKENPEKFIDFVADYYNLEKTHKFISINTYKDTEVPYRPKQYFSLSPEEIQFINNQLDWEIEGAIGFKMKFDNSD